MDKRVSRREQRYHLPSRINKLFHERVDPSLSKYLKLECIFQQPNVYLVRNFLKDSEMKTLDELLSANMSTFQASYTEDEDCKRVLSTERTSTYTYFARGETRLIRNIEQRASDLVDLNPLYIEPLQVVRYSDGQKFNLHHDAGTLLDEGEVDLIYPRRLITIFIYLNTTPIDIGCTVFPCLNTLKIQPVRGTALIFCNISPDGSADKRLAHFADAVQHPHIKYGLNLWICDRPLDNEIYDIDRQITGKRKATMISATVPLSILTEEDEHDSSTYPTTKLQTTESSKVVNSLSFDILSKLKGDNKIIFEPKEGEEEEYYWKEE
jgi:hypothetical protein